MAMNDRELRGVDRDESHYSSRGEVGLICVDHCRFGSGGRTDPRAEGGAAIKENDGPRRRNGETERDHRDGPSRHRGPSGRRST